MTRVGMIGLGKLGLPVAVAITNNFHVCGYDINPNLRTHRQYEHKEHGIDNDFQKLFDRECATGRLKFADTLACLVSTSDVIFVSVQTPHDPKFDGTKPLGTERSDFDYSYLVRVAKDLAPLVKPNQTVAIISTVLPGTIRREIMPILGGKCEVAYNPFFIATGTVMRDFLHTEFILLGGSPNAIQRMTDFYTDLLWYRVPKFHSMSIESAELAKVAYNSFITQKITFINSLMEIAHKIPGCNIDSVTDVLAGSERLAREFFKAGMSFGGPCSPRDCIAMSWLAGEIGIYSNPFEGVVLDREIQTSGLAEMLILTARKRELPIVILGKAFKEETWLTVGSPAVLLANILKELGTEFEHFDPYVDVCLWPGFDPAVYLIATKHACFESYKFPAGSVVIDPWRYIKDQDGVEVIRLGVGK